MQPQPAKITFVGAGLIAAQLAFLTSVCATQSPTITSQPQSQTPPTGTNVLFNVTATGHKPLGYQWQFNSITILDATNSDLLLTNVQCSNGGIYSVTVTNIAGTAISTGAVLMVIDTIPPLIHCPLDCLNALVTSAL